MSSDGFRGPAAGASSSWVHNTSIFREWETMKREISLHKWYESEKVGHDIGWDKATIDWMIRFGSRGRDS